MLTVGMPTELRTAIGNRKPKFENRLLFQFGADRKFLRRRIILNPQHIRFAADLAIFDIALPPSRKLIDAGTVPLAASRTLKTSFHQAIISEYLAGRFSLLGRKCRKVAVGLRVLFSAPCGTPLRPSQLKAFAVAKLRKRKASKAPHSQNPLPYAAL
jgi:hypothetical protein